MKTIFDATHPRLLAIRDVAHTLKAHLDNIVTYCRHRVNNAVAEGLNSKIMAIKHVKLALFVNGSKLVSGRCPKGC